MNAAASNGDAATSATSAGTIAPAALAARLAAETGIRARLAEPLATYTTMRVGGPADLLVEARSIAALVSAADFARATGTPLTVLGRGSNLVVSDRGIRGLVVVNRSADLRIEGSRLTAASGVALAKAATAAQQAALSGLEFGLAIPGSVGGAVWANAGAHGSDVSAVLSDVELLVADGSRIHASPADLRLAYRDSRLKHERTGERSLVLAATFQLSPASPDEIAARANEIKRWRREHQPLTLPSAGSIFRNPPGDSAGRLIDAAGLKGVADGGAAVSERHANFIVNSSRGTAADVRRLAERARRVVKDRFGVDLVFEVEFGGDWSGWSEEAQ